MKIKNLLAVLTAACLFATSFNAVASDETFKETVQINNAQDGSFLQEQPKVRSDGKNYYMVTQVKKILDGTINATNILTVGEDGPVIVEIISPFAMSILDKPLFPYTQRLFNYYQDNASINKYIRFVGKYTGNEKTIDGGLIPIITAFYIEFPDAPFNEVYDYDKLTGKKTKNEASTPSTAEKNAQETEESEQDYCKNAYATGNMPGMIECEGDALKVEDKRLNQEYKTVMSKLDKDQKKALRTKQRAWIKDRDKACKAEEDGGQAAELDHVSCLKEWTKKRADELAAMR